MKKKNIKVSKKKVKIVKKKKKAVKKVKKQLKKKKYISVQEHLYEAASVFEKDGICYANMNYISNPEFKGIDISQVLKIKID